MGKLKIKSVAFENADSSIFYNGKIELFKLIDEKIVEFTDSDFNIIYFLSGGSEKSAIENLNINKFYILLASENANCFAAASEVKSYMDSLNIKSVLLRFNDCKNYLIDFQKILKVKENLKNHKIGLIGETSHWLINSGIDKNLLSTKFGIKMFTLPWSDLSSFKLIDENKKFLTYFNNFIDSKKTIFDSGRIYSLLLDTVNKYHLSAISVECFSLVKKYKVTGCLPLAKLNDENIIAACEGDMVSCVSMLIVKELTNQISWMANLTDVNQNVYFSHCTVPTKLTKKYNILTHFETDEGTAVEGDFIEDEVTILRLNNKLDKAFLTTGKVIERPKNPNNCRTQIVVQIDESALNKLKTSPLGNHHIIIPKNHYNILKMFLEYFNFTII